MRLLALAALTLSLTAPTALAQDGDPFEVLSRNAGHRLGEQVRAQDPAFSLSLFEEGFRVGLTGDSTRIAYTFGYQYGLSIAADTLSNVSPEVFLSSFADGLGGRPSALSEADVAAAERAASDLITFRMLRASDDPEDAQLLADIERNGEAARAFLAEVAARPGVTQTPSGVLYTVDTPGAGASPTARDQAVVTYRGTFADGTEFDAGERTTFDVGGVVEGFSEMLQAMQPGETRTITLPPSTAYGLRGAPRPGGGGIPPNTALVFELTLHEVLPPAPRQAPRPAQR